jgi:hypothetical protein
MTGMHVRDQDGVVHSTDHTDEDDPGLRIGVPMCTGCFRLFVFSRWSNFFLFKTRSDVEKMHRTDRALTCVSCIADV